jgi:hypothetical protein
MTDQSWTPEEDEAFNEVEKHSNLGKQILRDMEGQPYHYDLFVSVSQRNQVLEEAAKLLEDAPPLVEFVKNEHGGCLICGFTPKLAAEAIRGLKR